ncbi:MAG: penicillin-binding protein 1A [Pigmentiphaga sp.]|nr:penicillin-binding protein 1A [Pigmentiphaga sp.]
MAKSSPPRSESRHGFSPLRWLFGLAVLGLGLVVSGALVGGLALALAWPNLPALDALIDYRPKVPLRVYTADQMLIAEFGEERRRVVPINEVPLALKQAILAAEDDRFYQHGGIDFAGVARAALTNLVEMRRAQGASTITMQVARNFYLSSEKTWSRKFYELLLTFKIESDLTKDQILELYINQIYLGHRSYGFEAAARTYFGKPLNEVSIAEAAMLAGIPKAPSRFNPLSNFPRAEIRQHYVLGRMRDLGYITPEQYKTAMDEVIQLRTRNREDGPTLQAHSQYVAELARQLVFDVYGDETYTRGLNVYTTIHSQDQQWAWEAVRKGILDHDRRRGFRGPEARIELPEGIERDTEAFDERLDEALREHPDSADLLSAVVLSASPDEVVVARNSKERYTVSGKGLALVKGGLGPKASERNRISRGAVVRIRRNGDAWEMLQMPQVQAAFVALSPDDGAIRAMVGGFDFQLGKFNRVTQAWRQPGSSFKPFIYAAALERGLTPTTRISDRPFVLEPTRPGEQRWEPKNYGNAYSDALTMREGLARSRNMVSIRILEAINPAYAQEYITRFGFDAARHPAYLTMALGAGAVTPLQMAGAYAVFANGGYRVPPYLITKVTNNDGQVLMEAKPTLAGDHSARAIDARTAFIADNMMRNNVATGTARRASQLKRSDVAGKTGTTNDSIDAWFAGYTPSLVGIAWMGFDQPRSLGDRETGGGAALPIWLDYMSHALKGVPEKKLNEPPGLLHADGTYYFSEFPPGQAIASVGLNEDPLRDLLDTLGLNEPMAQAPASPLQRLFGGGAAPPPPPPASATHPTMPPPAPAARRSGNDGWGGVMNLP